MPPVVVNQIVITDPNPGPVNPRGGRGLVFYDPMAPDDQMVVMRGHESDAPAGWLLSGGTDGAIDVAQQTFRPGAASGGYPAYPVNGLDPIQNIRDLDGSTFAGDTRP